MDSVSVSIAFGSKYRDVAIKKAFLISSVFGAFQGIMPLIGYGLGINFAKFVSSFDHWIAFTLLLFLGAKMIYESFNDSEDDIKDLSLKTIYILAIATSIDALAIGLSFAFLEQSIYLTSFIIALVTFVLCYIAIYIGNRLGSFLESKAEALGGVILIALGFKILFEHLN